MTEHDQSLGQTDGAVLLHYWVCSAPFFETSLLVAPARNTDHERRHQVCLRVFDPDGYPANQVSVEYQAGQVGIIELDPLMAGCKFESGMKHAHLEIEAASSIDCLCRIHTREGAAIMGRPVEMSSMRRIFLPMVFARDRFSLIALLNESQEEAIVRARFYCGKRSPEAVWSVPAKGARVISPAVEFTDYIEIEENEQVQAYVRLGVKGSQVVAAQLIERSRGTKEGSFFGVIS